MESAGIFVVASSVRMCIIQTFRLTDKSEWASHTLDRNDVDVDDDGPDGGGSSVQMENVILVLVQVHFAMSP